MKIIWNKVTKFSQVIAIILFVAVFFVGFLIGRKFENKFILGEPINSVKFVCADNKTINASFYKNFVHLEFGWQKTLYLPQTISADGGRYANADESIVFWNKGNTAFVTQGDPNNETYKDCVVAN
jgi:membrane-bound inhibitor of C-type lysozyme